MCSNKLSISLFLRFALTKEVSVPLYDHHYKDFFKFLRKNRDLIFRF